MECLKLCMSWTHFQLLPDFCFCCFFSVAFFSYSFFFASMRSTSHVFEGKGCSGGKSAEGSIVVVVVVFALLIP